MVHNQLYALRVGVGIEGIYVKVWVRSLEIKYIVLVAVCPVFPANVPSFNQKGVEAVFGCKVYVSANLFVVGTVLSVWLCILIVGDTEHNGREVIGI